MPYELQIYSRFQVIRRLMESTHEGVNSRSKYVTRVEIRNTSTSSSCLVEFMYLVFTRMPGESYRRLLRTLLYLCYVFRALINSFV